VGVIGSVSASGLRHSHHRRSEGFVCAGGAPQRVDQDSRDEGTLKALAAHTEIGELLPADGGNCEEVLAQFARAGIDVDALAAQLQDEGDKSFVKSWNDLMSVISSKCALLA
jgi:transaldolase